MTAPILVERREDAERALALEIAALVRAKPDAVLGLATGETQVGVYRQLIRMRGEGLDLSRVVTFNLDEYVDLPADHPASFRSWIRERFLDPAGVRPGNIHIPASGPAPEETGSQGERYELAIRAAGGIDLQILGIGRNGHIGFNEPGSARETRTRRVDLRAETREDASSSFGGLESTPRSAITMGVATILDARRLRVLAFGPRKAAIVKRALEGPVGPEVPATFLRGHPDLRIWIDRAAATELSPYRRPVEA